MTVSFSHANPAASVAVVIPHLDRLADTSACCRSLAAQTMAPVLVLVMDNASPTHSEAELAAACPCAHVLRLETNRGFSGSVNIGIRHALDSPDIRHVWVLNNDTVCPPETLAKLVATADADPRIGLVGCPLLEGTEQTGLVRVSALWQMKRLWAIPVSTGASSDSDYLTGASLFIKRELIEDIGLFDEGFFFFFEDADYSRRAVQKGWKLAVAPDAAIIHRGSSTIRSLGELKSRYYRAGHVRYLRKYSRFPALAAWPPFVFRLVMDAFGLRMGALRGNRRGWRDGWS